MGRGKSKGNAFERNICQDIIAAFGVSPQDVYRSILSGGHKDSFGDISMTSALAKKFPYAIECKFYKNANIHDLFMPWKKMPKTKERFAGWWIQTLAGARKCKRAPLCVFKANKLSILCAAVLSDLPKDQQAYFRSIPHLTSLCPARPKGSLHRIIVIPWATFLQSCADHQKGKKK